MAGWGPSEVVGAPATGKPGSVVEVATVGIVGSMLGVLFYKSIGGAGGGGRILSLDSEEVGA